MSGYTLKLWILCQAMLEDAKDHFRTLERGQGMVEYSLILALISIAAIAVLTSIGGQVDARFDQILACLDNDTNTACA